VQWFVSIIYFWAFITMENQVKLNRPVRIFVTEDFKIDNFESIEFYTKDLLNRSLADLESLKQWFLDRSELESIVSEDLGWRYIRMTCHTDDATYQKSYEDFIEHIQPRLAPVMDQLNRKALDAFALPELAKIPGYDLLVRNMKKEVEIFREENVPLFTEINKLTQRYAQLSGAMTVELDGKELTLQQAAVLLHEPDRGVREAAWRKINARRLQDAAQLEEIFNELIRLRHQVALNAGFENFRDYMFKSLGRFDYTPADCKDFHHAVAAQVVPLLKDFSINRRNLLGVPTLRPWDKVVDAEGRSALKAFRDGNDLAEKAIACFNRLDPYLGNCLNTMRAMGHLDLESRKGKAPGGYNYPLPEIGVPFIFMNATSTMRDMTTMMHEGGHAVHNFLTRTLPLHDFKSPGMEVAELASMSMELISMDHWDIFFNDAQDLKRAVLEQLEDILETLPWVATIDKFQHWIYENPFHTAAERIVAWNKIFDAFSDGITDYRGLEASRDFMWHKQLHLFEVPFYYIEYGIAQLGAIAVWRNYKQDPKTGLAGYKKALSLGNMYSIPETYQAAGIKFSFSTGYIRELMDFVGKAIQAAQ
jgi:oligoendopeptidase F